MTGPDTDVGAYGLHRPTMSDARDAMHRVHGDTGGAQWTRLLTAAQLTGNETDEAALVRLIDAMAKIDPVSQMCAQALRIRLATHTHLTAAHTVTRSSV